MTPDLDELLREALIVTPPPPPPTRRADTERDRARRREQLRHAWRTNPDKE